MENGAILVSGGSKGLGLEVVRHLLGEGHQVSAFARSRTAGIAELEERFAQTLYFEEIEARDPAGLAAFVKRAATSGDGIHGLVNNAAVGQDSLLVHTTPETIENIVGVNLVASILLTRLVLKEMLLQETGGRIVNIGSICGRRGFAGLTVYSATKAALEGLTRSLAREVGGRKILVNAIAPGFFESEMSSVLSDEQTDAIRRRTPTGRLCVPPDLLPLLDLLLFAETNLTGEVIAVDGGAAC